MLLKGHLLLELSIYILLNKFIKLQFYFSFYFKDVYGKVGLIYNIIHNTMLYEFKFLSIIERRKKKDFSYEISYVSMYVIFLIKKNKFVL